jgi:hypothetical protein
MFPVIEDICSYPKPTGGKLGRAIDVLCGRTACQIIGKEYGIAAGIVTLRASRRIAVRLGGATSFSLSC